VHSRSNPDNSREACNPAAARDAAAELIRFWVGPICSDETERTTGLRVQVDAVASGRSDAGGVGRRTGRDPVGERQSAASAARPSRRGCPPSRSRAAQRQLEQYFGGERTAFDLPLDEAGTEFQRRVWQALRTIPFGETRSCGQLAAQLGHPRAVRAVGAANGRNPVSIVTPCHRVIGANGKLTGFAGGLAAKAYLLALEQPSAQGTLDI
jgi:O-6-methylguanine DNA methyltransferase